MKQRGSRRAVVVVALAVGAVGCELALDFDRTKIDGGGVDASFGDVPAIDQNVPDVPTDTPAGDSGSDAPADSGANDTGTDTGADTGTDTGAADAEDAG